MVAAAVGEACGVAHEVLYGHLPSRLDQLASLHNFESTQFGKEPPDLIPQPELAFFVERHQSDADDRLGHGVDAEDRVVGHRSVGFPVGHADRLPVGDLAFAGHDADRPGELAEVDILLHGLGDAVKSLLRQAHFRRSGPREFGSCGADGECENEQRGAQRCRDHGLQYRRNGLRQSLTDCQLSERAW